MAGPTAVTSPALRLAISIIVVLGLALPPIAALHAASNVLLSGETLVAGSGLAHGHRSFVMRDDCNLALDDGVWQSGTAGRGGGCRLTLEGDGRLVIRSEDGATVWSSVAEPNRGGEYVAVLEPVGRVTVYGPAVWSAAELGGYQLRNRLGCLKGGNWDNCIVVGDGESVNSPLLLLHRDGHRHRRQRLNCLHGGKRDNCIINGAAPTADGVLFSGPRRFGLRGGCGGVRCFLRIDQRGGLAVVGDEDQVIWSNNVRSAEGEYVAILRQAGEVAVYGPAIWSTAGGLAGHPQQVATRVNRKIADVKMVTDRE